MSEDTDLDARARYAILKKLDTTMPPARGRGQRSWMLSTDVDHTFKAEETNTGHRGPVVLASELEPQTVASVDE